MSWVAGHRKAIVALVIPLLGGLVAAFPGSTVVRAVSVAVTAVFTSAGVFATSNASADPAPPAG